MRRKGKNVSDSGEQLSEETSITEPKEEDKQKKEKKAKTSAPASSFFTLPTSVLAFAFFCVLILCIIFLSFKIHRLGIEIDRERQGWLEEKTRLLQFIDGRKVRGRKASGRSNRTDSRVKRAKERTTPQKADVRSEANPNEKPTQTRTQQRKRKWNCRPQLVEVNSTSLLMTWDDPVFSLRFLNLSASLARSLVSTTATDLSFQVSKNLTSEFSGHHAMTFVWRETDKVALSADVASGFYSTQTWQGRVVTAALQPKPKKAPNQPSSAFKTAVHKILHTTRGNITERVASVYKRLKNSKPLHNSFLGVLGYEQDGRGGVGYTTYPEKEFSYKTQFGNYSFYVFLYST